MTAGTDDARTVEPAEPGEPTEPMPPPGASGDEAAARAEGANPARILIGLLGMGVIGWFVANASLSFAYYPEWYADSKILIGLLALVVGLGGAYGFFYCLNMFVEGLPGRLSRGLMPYAFLAPAFALLGLMLLYPTVQTINYSFANRDATEYVGLENYRDVLGSDAFQSAIFNNVLWLIIVPALTVVFGVIVAVLADKLSTTGEKVSKSVIFLPMAISFVGASTIWLLVYAYDPDSEPATGLLNALWRGLGGDPQTWLQNSDGRLNSVLMMVILVWLQVGFAMILLSSAIKGVPEDTLEAARIDGASELQIFFRVVIPQIKGTIITVFITVVILVLKVFDIVYVLTDGRDKTQVIANLFFTELFRNSQSGRASAIVVILLIAVTPVLIYQVRHFRREESGR